MNVISKIAAYVLKYSQYKMQYHTIPHANIRTSRHTHAKTLAHTSARLHPHTHTHVLPTFVTSTTFVTARQFCQFISTAFVNLTTFVNFCQLRAHQFCQQYQPLVVCRYRRGHYFCQQGPTTFVKRIAYYYYYIYIYIYIYIYTS